MNIMNKIIFEVGSMYKKIAVAIIHGIGNQEDDFASKTEKIIEKQFYKKLKKWISADSEQLIIHPVHWSTVLINRADELYKDLVLKKHQNYKLLRRFIIHYLGDAIAYQPIKEAKNNTYMKIHKRVSETLHHLANDAGYDAPLCVISHSLGSVIASNFFYDLQKNNRDLIINKDSYLEKGETLALFYTLGTTLPLWSLRHDFDQPINIPSKLLNKHYPQVKGEWINFYSKNDVLGFPLKEVSERYQNSVTEDRIVRIGNLLTFWNPLCHIGYFRNKRVLNRITDQLVLTWKQINSI